MTNVLLIGNAAREHVIAETFKKNVLVKLFSYMKANNPGCFNLTYLDADGEMIILRDLYGFRPLVHGQSPDGKIFMAASESNALLNCGIKKIKSFAIFAHVSLEILPKVILSS